MGHLDELWAKYKDRGLVVLAVTNEGRSLVDKFVEETQAEHPIVIESGDSMTEYGGSGFPSSYLIGPDGRIVWAGHPASINDRQIEEHLASVRLRPELPRTFSRIAKSLDREKYGDALEGLKSELADEGLDTVDREAAKEMVAWLEWKARALLEGGHAAVRSGDFYAASLSFSEAERLFEGHEVAEKAEAALKEVLSDKERKREVEAGEALAKARDRASRMKDKQAAAFYRALARKYEGTKAATKAEEMAKRLDR